MTFIKVAAGVVAAVAAAITIYLFGAYSTSDESISRCSKAVEQVLSDQRDLNDQTYDLIEPFIGWEHYQESPLKELQLNLEERNRDITQPPLSEHVDKYC